MLWLAWRKNKVFGKFFRRVRALRRTELLGQNSKITFGRNLEIDVHSKGVITILRGTLTLGVAFPQIPRYSTKQNSVFVVEEGGVVEVHGSVWIAPGVTVQVRKNGRLVFRGNNFISHDSIILCRNEITFEEGAMMSWNVTLIDDDGHTLFQSDGTPLRKIQKSLRIGKNTGIQMNVLVPAGVDIGSNCLIAAGTVLRQNLPDNSLIYGNGEMKLHKNIGPTANP